MLNDKDILEAIKMLSEIEENIKLAINLLEKSLPEATELLSYNSIKEAVDILRRLV